MGFFDSVGDLLGLSNSNAQDHADSARLNLGNIFLPGGLGGGAMNENPFSQGQGFGGSPLNEGDWQNLNKVWGTVRSAGNFGDINWGAVGGDSLSGEAKQFLGNNWGTIRSAANLGDINWKHGGIVGAPKYAPPAGAPGAPGGAPGAPASTLGDLEPARGMFANIAAGMPVGGNTQGNILQLMRRQAQPFEDRAFQRINQNLFSRGRLGAQDSATGDAYEGFARGLSEADTGRQLASFGLSDQLQTSQLNRQLGGAQGAAGLTQLSTLPFDLALKLATARSQSALGQANSAAYQNDSLVDAWSKFWSFG